MPKLLVVTSFKLIFQVVLLATGVKILVEVDTGVATACLLVVSCVMVKPLVLVLVPTAVTAMMELLPLSVKVVVLELLADNDIFL